MTLFTGSADTDKAGPTAGCRVGGWRWQAAVTGRGLREPPEGQECGGPGPEWGLHDGRCVKTYRAVQLECGHLSVLSCASKEKSKKE